MNKDYILIKQIDRMFEMQDELNSFLNPEWKTQPWDWQRAIMLEAAELMEGMGWKWWKKQNRNIEQDKLEVVDIGHFLISDILKESDPDQFLYKKKSFYINLIESSNDYTRDGFYKLHKNYEHDMHLEGVQQAIASASHRSFGAHEFVRLMQVMDLTPEELCKTYIIKNTLNIFRYKHGYKDGTYIKIWNGKEDNQVLMELSKTLDPADAEFPNKLYEALELEYSKL